MKQIGIGKDEKRYKLTKRKVKNLCLADKEKGYKSWPGNQRDIGNAIQ